MKEDIGSSANNTSGTLEQEQPKSHGVSSEDIGPSQIFYEPSDIAPTKKRKTTENQLGNHDTERKSATVTSHDVDLSLQQHNHVTENGTVHTAKPTERPLTPESANEEFDYRPETHTAFACGLEYDSLSPEEIGLLPERADPDFYVEVRNSVLLQWRRDVSRRLSLNEALKNYKKDKERPYIMAAWTFLDAMGYINFGVSEEIQNHLSSETNNDTYRGSIIIIGAGCAGLAAARQLRAKGYRVLVVEGRNRPGGRVHTVKLSCKNAEHVNAVSDLGGSIITGIDGNPLAILTRQLGIPLLRIGDECPLYMADGSIAHPELDAIVEHHYNKVLMRQSQRLREKKDIGADMMSLRVALELLWRRHYPELDVPTAEELGLGMDDAFLVEGGNPFAKSEERIIPSKETIDKNTTATTTTIDKNTTAINTTASNTDAASVSDLPAPFSSPSHQNPFKQSPPKVPLPSNPSIHNGTILQTHSPEEIARQLLEWHYANLEFANACLLDEISLAYWDQDDPHELQGAHCFVPGCNGRWVKELCKGIPIMYNNPVQEVRYCKTGVAVHTAHNKTIHADAVIVTVPLGVLKKKDGIRFNPPLSERKRGAIDRLGFGNLNKVVFLFPYVFWNDQIDMFGNVHSDPENRGEAFLFYSYANVSGGAQLTALIAGAAANSMDGIGTENIYGENIEEMMGNPEFTANETQTKTKKKPSGLPRPAQESAARVMTILRRIFEPQGICIPPPLDVVCTHWGKDPMAYGAYSSMKVGTQGGVDYDILSESIGGRVFFAGEATIKKYPATMHGAFYSGLWTAANVDSSLRKVYPDIYGNEYLQAALYTGRHNNTSNGAVGMYGNENGQRNEKRVGISMMGTANGTSTSVMKGRGPGSKEQHKPPVFMNATSAQISLGRITSHRAGLMEEEKVQHLLLVSSRLKMLFEDSLYRPDLEFGSFAAVFGLQDTKHADNCLLRIDFNSARKMVRNMGKATTYIYCLLSKDIVYSLADMPPDDKRLSVLANMPGAVPLLTGRAFLSDDAIELMESVLKWRKQNATVNRVTSAALTTIVEASTWPEKSVAAAVDAAEKVVASNLEYDAAMKYVWTEEEMEKRKKGWQRQQERKKKITNVGLAAIRDQAMHRIQENMKSLDGNGTV